MSHRTNPVNRLSPRAAFLERVISQGARPSEVIVATAAAVPVPSNAIEVWCGETPRDFVSARAATGANRTSSFGARQGRNAEGRGRSGPGIPPLSHPRIVIGRAGTEQEERELCVCEEQDVVGGREATEVEPVGKSVSSLLATLITRGMLR